MNQTNTVSSVRSSGQPSSGQPSSDASVFVIDEDKSVREYLESLIARAGWQPRSFDSAKAFLAYPRLIAPSCLVSDISLPDVDGLLLQGLLADRRELPIIFLASGVDVSIAVQAMKGGAVEFLTKPVDEKMLLNALRQALECSCDALQRERTMRTLRHAYASLSCREQQVMRFLIQGMMHKQIGAELGISVITVKAHRSNLMRKMGAHSLAELVTMAVSLGAVPVMNQPGLAMMWSAVRPSSGHDRVRPDRITMDMHHPLLAGMGALASG